MVFSFANVLPVSAAGVPAKASYVTSIDALRIVMDATGNTPSDAKDNSFSDYLYLRAAGKTKIVDDKFWQKEKQNITQEAIGDMIGKALKLTPTKKVYFADTKNAYINTLYELKIVDGVKDKTGKLFFKPATVITKTEFMGIVDKTNKYHKSRLPKPTLTPTVPKSVADANGLYNIPYYPEEPTMVQYPRTAEEFEKAILCAMASGKLDFTINYPVHMQISLNHLLNGISTKHVVT